MLSPLQNKIIHFSVFKMEDTTTIDHALLKLSAVEQTNPLHSTMLPISSLPSDFSPPSSPPLPMNSYVAPPSLFTSEGEVGFKYSTLQQLENQELDVEEKEVLFCHGNTNALILG